MVSVQSQNNRKNNGTDNDDGGSVINESSPPYQTRKDYSGSGGDEYASNIICCNVGISNSWDFEKNDDNDDDDDDDGGGGGGGEGSDDGNLSWRVEEEIKERDSNDTLIDSLEDLRISQEALQLEIEKFWFIGNGSFLPDGDDSANYRSEATEASVVDLGFHGSCSSVGGKQISSSSVEHQVVSLTEKIKNLESKLEELLGLVALKNSMIAELETAFTGGEFTKEESTSNIGFLDEKFKELKSELESFFRQKIETEIKYLIIKQMMQNLKVASALAEKQKAISGSEVQIPKLEEAGNEDPIMKNITDEESVLEVTRIRQLKRLALGILIILLCFIVWELMPNSEEVFVVPT
ncbi:unnamed protein product [Trifolium pratense]|uniref:Uncharacterized protein n=1 Tax=Trifolium pratense TaxID=57577 RepID=A0ACB0IWW5_TRIPR|nr:unnamed protein product [Trifolium pratense]